MRENAKHLIWGLLFDDADVAAMRARYHTHPMFADLRKKHQEMDLAGLRKFLSDEVRYNDHLYHIVRVANAAEELAFVYLMTSDTERAQLSIACIRTLMKFPKWDYFLEDGKHVLGIQRGSSSILAVALCSDWLGEQVSEEERSKWLTTMGERGCEACFLSLYGMRYKDRVKGWSMDPTSTYFEHRPHDRVDMSNWPTILDKTNLKAVPAGALAVAAIAHEKGIRASEKTARWLEQARYSLRTFEEFYSKDGAYNEGVSYANYTSLHIGQAIIALERAGRPSLFNMINWPGYIDYCLALSMPVHDNKYDILNIGDNGSTKSGEAGRPKRSAVPLWLANRTRDPLAQWFAEERGGDPDYWSVILMDSSIKAEAPPQKPSLWHSELDWIVARTGHQADDLVVSMRSGGPANHEHSDRNSIIVKCYGEELIADPYRPPYQFADPDWLMRTTYAHSAVLIDGKPHQYHDGSEGTNPSDAQAHIIRRGERKGYYFWTSDATPAYALVNADIDSVTRTMVVLHTFPAILILDKVQRKTKAGTLQARFFCA